MKPGDPFDLTKKRKKKAGALLLIAGRFPIAFGSRRANLAARFALRGITSSDSPTVGNPRSGVRRRSRNRDQFH
jgi:hypothetical protein